jgi:hypothetical protein
VLLNLFVIFPIQPCIFPVSIKTDLTQKNINNIFTLYTFFTIVRKKERKEKRLLWAHFSPLFALVQKKGARLEGPLYGYWTRKWQKMVSPLFFSHFRKCCIVDIDEFNRPISEAC